MARALVPGHTVIVFSPVAYLRDIGWITFRFGDQVTEGAAFAVAFPRCPAKLGTIVTQWFS